MILTHVKPEDIKPLWPRVREALGKLEQLDPDWQPEDAYHLLRMPIEHGGAVLTLIADDGFLIWQRYPGDDGRGLLFVLACVSWGMVNAMLKHYPHVYKELDELATKMNCKKIRHISKHAAWEGKHWKLLGHVYEREV